MIKFSHDETSDVCELYFNYGPISWYTYSYGGKKTNIISSRPYYMNNHGPNMDANQ